MFQGLRRGDTWDGESTEPNGQDEEGDGDTTCVREANHQQQSGFHPESCHYSREWESADKGRQYKNLLGL